MFDKERFEIFYDVIFNEYGDIGVKRKDSNDKYPKYFGYMYSRPLYFMFNEKVEGETDEEKYKFADKLAEEGKIIKTTAQELYETYSGKTREELFIQHKGYDLKTKKYIDTCYENMGYTGQDIGWNEYKYELIRKYNIYVNSSAVDVGKLEDGRYIATYAMQTAIDDYANFNYFFSREPKKQDIENIAILENIIDHLGEYKDYKFNCWECGCEVHWLDAVTDNDKSLGARLENLKNHYCGC